LALTCLLSFPLTVPQPGAPFPPLGPSGRFPSFISTVERSDFLTPFPLCLVFLRRHGTCRCMSFRSRLGPCIGRCGPGVCSPGFAAPACLSTGDVRISQVPRGPLCTRPVLRPRWAGSARPCPFSRADPVLPSATGTALATTIISISRLHHAARAPAVYASWLGYPSPRKTRFQPGALPLAGRDFHPLGPFLEFHQVIG
jgi:hypothetical protein